MIYGSDYYVLKRINYVQVVLVFEVKPRPYFRYRQIEWL